MDLEERAQTVLIGLLMVSEGKTSTLNPNSTHGGERDYTPLAEVSWHDYHRRQIMRAHGYRQRKEAVESAEQALQISRGGTVRRPPRDSLAWHELVAKDTRKPCEIAADFKITRQYVWQIKRAAQAKAA